MYSEFWDLFRVYYLKSMSRAAMKGRRFPLHHERVNRLGQEDRQRATGDKIDIAGYRRALVVTVVIIVHGIIILIILLRVLFLLRVWK